MAIRIGQQWGFMPVKEINGKPAPLSCRIFQDVECKDPDTMGSIFLILFSIPPDVT